MSKTRQSGAPLERLQRYRYLAPALVLLVGFWGLLLAGSPIEPYNGIPAKCCTLSGSGPLEGLEASQVMWTAALLLEQREFGTAREYLRQLRNELLRSDAELARLLDLSFEEDEHFLAPTATLHPRDLSSITHLGGGSTITLRFLQGESTTEAFKPDQTRRQSNYRAEIASWRLCQLIGCSFEIPYNRPLRVSREDFNILYGRHSCPKQSRYARNFSDLIWRHEEGSEYLHGTGKAWVNGIVKIPLELTSVWTPWLSQESGSSQLEVPLRQAVAAWKTHPGTTKHYPRFLSQANGLTTKGLARQISDVLVFDYLVGNWDRLSTLQAYWGANCHFTNGRFVSIDNGATFNTYSNRKVQALFQKVQRFNRSLIQELRHLNKAKTREWLFPGTSRFEEKAFEQFWRQREAVLKRVDELVALYGEAAVFAFE